jgi:hypothetical protein
MRKTLALGYVLGAIPFNGFLASELALGLRFPVARDLESNVSLVGTQTLESTSIFQRPKRTRLSLTQPTVIATFMDAYPAWIVRTLRVVPKLDLHTGRAPHDWICLACRRHGTRSS